MSDIPSEIFREILLHLPAESLFRFRSVCKSWQSIIDDPLFVRTHTTNNHRTSPRLLIGTSTGAFISFSLDSLDYVNGEQTIHATQVKNLTATNPQWMALCNGLILFFHYLPGKTWVIWNTLTGDFHELPQPDLMYGRAAPMGAAIGYDSRSDDYKVVRISKFHWQEGGVARTLIYSLKSKSWRMILNWPADEIDSMTRGVYLDGAVHWKTSRETIVALDLATEEYREFQAALPPTVSPQRVPSLNAFDGYLVLSNAEDMRRTWVMRGYGTNEPIWVELISAKEQEVFCRLEQFCRPSLFAYSNSENCLFVQYANKILRWDIEKRSEKWVVIDGLPGYVTSFQVVPGSLFRLNGGGSTSFAMERTSEEASSSRLKLIATTIPSDGDPAGEMIKDIMKQVVSKQRQKEKEYKTKKDVLDSVLAEAGLPRNLFSYGLTAGQIASGYEEAEIQVPSKMVGFIVGEDGETIRNINYRSRTRIQLIPPNPSDGEQSKEWIVRITGGEEELETAREMIEEVMTQASSPLSTGLSQATQQPKPLHVPPKHNGPQLTPYAQGGPTTHTGHGPPQDQYGKPRPQGPPPHAQPYGQQPNQPVEADPYQGLAQTYGQRTVTPSQHTSGNSQHQGVMTSSGKGSKVKEVIAQDEDDGSGKGESEQVDPCVD